MAINFKLTERFYVDPAGDPMDRDWVGYDPQRTAEELFEQNRGIWRLGPRAKGERYATFSHHGQIILAAEIAGVELCAWKESNNRPDKKAVVGRVLEPGDSAHEYFIGRAVDGHRNPVSYIEDPGPRPAAHERGCACGCGIPVGISKKFAPGHDQRAVHERIARGWGDTLRFIEWFDAEYPDGAPKGGGELGRVGHA